jgi:hypothetical protein
MIRQRLDLDYYTNLADMNRTTLNTHIGGYALVRYIYIYKHIDEKPARALHRFFAAKPDVHRRHDFN